MSVKGKTRRTRPAGEPKTPLPGPEPEPDKPEDQASGPLLIRASRALLKGWVALPAMVMGTIVAAAKDALTGFIPSAASVAAFAKLHPTVSTVGLTIGVAVTIAAALIVWRYDRGTGEKEAWPAALDWLRSPKLAYGSMVVAMSSTLALLALVGLLVARPSWCPQSVCPPRPPAVPGPHDSYLASDVLEIQSGGWVIGGDPTTYSLAHLPLSGSRLAVAAAHVTPANGTGAQSTDEPYVVAIRVTSLRADQGDLSIEAVSLVVGSAKPAGRTNVWSKPPPVRYTHNPFRARYAGQTAASFVDAPFAGVPEFGHVHLKPGETDALAIAVTSNVRADVTFKVRLEYRYVGEPKTHVFVIPYPLEVLFVDPTDWYGYQLRNGKLEPA